ncbi:MAG TPA: methyltransferase domain-containing protein [Thermoanaerobaculia bacterium]|nr:methyltransferase domain-containing protein [Thermoanaerobaculia bacterium]
MKDIVANRRQLAFRDKLRLGWTVLRENGPLWTAWLAAYYGASGVAERAHRGMESRRRAKGLPGLNSVGANRLIWNAWDWSHEGEEWTTSPEWKDSFVRSVLVPHVAGARAVLEIGPGGGRWTAELLQRVPKVVAVDVSETCIERCRARFADYQSATFLVGDGRSLTGVADASVDRIFSFAAFVHIDRRDVEAYAPELRRVLEPGGRGAIHHGGVGGVAGGWRSNLTAEDMARYLTEAGLEVVSQEEGWRDGDVEVTFGPFRDVTTVFRRPAADRTTGG